MGYIADFMEFPARKDESVPDTMRKAHGKAHCN